MDEEVPWVVSGVRSAVTFDRAVWVDWEVESELGSGDMGQAVGWGGREWIAEPGAREGGAACIEAGSFVGSELRQGVLMCCIFRCASEPFL